jgi:hypothetical protein
MQRRMIYAAVLLYVVATHLASRCFVCGAAAAGASELLAAVYPVYLSAMLHTRAYSVVYNIVYIMHVHSYVTCIYLLSSALENEW